MENLGGRDLRLTIGGEVPDGLRAELEDRGDFGVLVVIADKSLIGEPNDLALGTGMGLSWEDWDDVGGVTSMSLTNLYPRVGPDRNRTPLRDPAY